MPNTANNGHDDSFEEHNGGGGDDHGPGGERGDRKSGRGPSKVKDLSHVPCKFFKLDACTAGASCPFSHQLSEPGRPKDVCTWFVKGNCKFGHKCALAHVLPGQPLSMDRKNKKAAQQMTAGANAGAGGGGGKGDQRRRGGRNRGERGPGDAPPGLGRPPLAITKPLGPSTAAPPVTASNFDLPHDEALLHVTPAKPAPAETSAVPDVPPGLGPPGLPQPAAAAAASTATTTTTTTVTAPSAGATPSDTPVRPPPLPLSTPTASGQRRAADYGFGPIGSPPRSSPSGRGVNGFPGSPGTSPTYNDGGSGFPSSLSVPKASLLRPGGAFAAGWTAPRGHEVAVDDEDLEEALPSSLNELLTDSERERRWSRTGGTRPSVEALHHRYSRSVPATNWMDAASSGPGSLPKWDMLSAGTGGEPGTSLGTTGSGMLGMSLSPSNASGAFLGRAAPLRQPQPTPGTITTSHSFDEDARDTVGHLAATSPGARALAAFAPGQSLPQGLAAGASRIHMMSNIGSVEWARSPPAETGASLGPQRMFAATGRSVSGGSNASAGAQSQRKSDRWLLSSPLAGPVITNDADEGLFDFDT